MCSINHTRKRSAICPTFCRGPWTLCKVVPLVCGVPKPEESPLSPADTAYRRRHHKAGSDYIVDSSVYVNFKKMANHDGIECEQAWVTLAPASSESTDLLDIFWFWKEICFLQCFLCWPLCLRCLTLVAESRPSFISVNGCVWTWWSLAPVCLTGWSYTWL